MLIYCMYTEEYLWLGSGELVRKMFKLTRSQFDMHSLLTKHFIYIYIAEDHACGSLFQMGVVVCRGWRGHSYRMCKQDMVGHQTGKGSVQIDKEHDSETLLLDALVWLHWGKCDSNKDDYCWLHWSDRTGSGLAASGITIADCTGLIELGEG